MHAHHTGTHLLVLVPTYVCRTCRMVELWRWNAHSATQRIDKDTNSELCKTRFHIFYNFYFHYIISIMIIIIIATVSFRITTRCTCVVCTANQNRSGESERCTLLNTLSAYYYYYSFRIQMALATSVHLFSQFYTNPHSASWFSVRLCIVRKYIQRQHHRWRTNIHIVHFGLNSCTFRLVCRRVNAHLLQTQYANATSRTISWAIDQVNTLHYTTMKVLCLEGDVNANADRAHCSSTSLLFSFDFPFFSPAFIFHK